jgi:hypothetical protein
MCIDQGPFSAASRRLTVEGPIASFFQPAKPRLGAVEFPSGWSCNAVLVFQSLVSTWRKLRPGDCDCAV